jgi:CspA family cold shock protein
MTGTVKTVHLQKGFGFIVAADGQEYFFHRSCLLNELEFAVLNVGTPVTFDPTSNAKGPRAERVARFVDY